METSNSSFEPLFGSIINKENYLKDVSPATERERSANPQTFAQENDQVAQEDLHEAVKPSAIEEQVSTTTDQPAVTPAVKSSQERLKELGMKIEKAPVIPQPNTNTEPEMFTFVKQTPKPISTSLVSVEDDEVVVQDEWQPAADEKALQHLKNTTPLKDFKTKLYSQYDENDTSATLCVTPKALATFLDTVNDEVELMRNYLFLLSQDVVHANQAAGEVEHAEENTLVISPKSIDKLTSAIAHTQLFNETLYKQYLERVTSADRNLQENIENFNNRIDQGNERTRELKQLCHHLFTEFSSKEEELDDKFNSISELYEALDELKHAKHLSDFSSDFDDSLLMMQKDNDDENSSFFDHQSTGALTPLPSKKSHAVLYAVLGVVGILLIFAVYFQVWQYIPGK